jgi:hypothetical protein
VRNPLDRPETARLVLDGQERAVELGAHGEATVPFTVSSDAPRVIGVDVSFGDLRYGTQAEAIVE